MPQAAIGTGIALALSALVAGSPPTHVDPDQTSQTRAAVPTEVRAPPQTRPPAQQAAPPQATYPQASQPGGAPSYCSLPCQEGYRCLDNQCVSACPQGCAAGQRCSSYGQCYVPEPERKPLRGATFCGGPGARCSRPAKCVYNRCVITDQYLSRLDYQARKRSIQGIVFLSLGPALVAGGVALLIDNYNQNHDGLFIGGSLMTSFGGIGSVLGAILLGVGQNKRHRHTLYSKQPLVRVVPSPNGLGLKF